MGKMVRSPTEPGDIILSDKARRDPEQQPLSEREKALVRRAYALYDDFRDRLRTEHDAMREARLMRQLRQDERSHTAPASNTLNSCIDNVIADQIDNMPEAKMVPEREETARSAEELSDVVAYVLYHANWPDAYQAIMEDAAVTGTGVAEVFWDDDLEDGDGMASVLAWHPEDFFPDPMYENIQDGRACFKTTRTTVAWIEEHYPDAKGYVHGDSAEDGAPEQTERWAQTPDGDEPVTLLEFWYKRFDAKKRKSRVHMAQFAGRALLYSTELGFGCSESEYRQGVYAHGMYPFTLFRYRKVFRRPFGTGLIHDYRDTQNAIDRYQKYIDDNARQSAIQRHFVRKGSGINIDDVADLRRTIIEWEGNDIREVMQTVQANPLNGQVYQIMNYMVDAMKQDCGQNQFSRGEGGLGVTAASAIQALQEAGGKITRWHTESYKAAFRDMVVQLVWVLSEYMSADRQLRIVGGWDSTDNMVERLITMTAPKTEGDEMLKPAYSVRVQVQKNNPLQIQINNELLQQAAQVCAQAGQPMPPEVFIGLMQGYPNKSGILRAVRESSAIHQQMQAMQQQIEQLTTQLDQQRRANAGYRKALATPGGGYAQQSAQAQAQAPDYSGMTQAADTAAQNAV